MDIQYLELGVVGFALLFIIKQLFSFLKEMNTKKQKNGIISNNELGLSEKLLAELSKMNNNHLHTIQETMKDLKKDTNVGNDRVVEAISKMHIDLAGCFGEIKGSINNKK